MPSYSPFGETEFEQGLGVFGEPSVGGGGGGSVGDLTNRTARSNIDASGNIAQLAAMVNSINQRAQQASNAGRIPGGAGLEAISSGNINRALSGKIDPSVLANLAQGAAEFGVGTGSPGGPSSTAAYLRALGLTTMDLMNTGQDWLTKATARNPGAPLFDPSSMMLTPAQFGALDMERSRLPRGGGSYGPSYGGGGRGFGATTASPIGDVNWGDLFGGSNRINTPAIEEGFPYGIGTGGGDNPLIMFGNDPTNYGEIPVGSSIGGGVGLFEDAFEGF